MQTFVKFCIIAIPFIAICGVVGGLWLAGKKHFEDTDEFLNAMNNEN